MVSTHFFLVLCTSYLVLLSYSVKLDLQTIGFSHSFALTGFEVQALHLTHDPSPNLGEGNWKRRNWYGL